MGGVKTPIKQTKKMEQFNEKQTYWSENGKYQKEMDIMWELVPPHDAVEIPTDTILENAIECVRAINRLYYDVYNNGGGNIVDSPYYDDEDGEWEINSYYEGMLSDIEAFIGLSPTALDDLFITFGQSKSADFKDCDCIKLEGVSDKVIEKAWGIYQERDLTGHKDNLKSIIKRNGAGIKYPKDTYKVETQENRDLMYFILSYPKGEFGEQKISKVLSDWEKYKLKTQPKEIDFRCDEHDDLGNGWESTDIGKGIYKP